MTIIFSCIPQDGSSPYIGADMLLSSNCPSVEFNFPSKRSQEAKIHGKLLNRSVQKLYVIHPCIAVALCGYEKTAEKFINRLSAEFKDKVIDFGTFVSDVDYCYGVSKSDEKGKGFGFTLIAYDTDNNHFIHHHQGCDKKDFRRLGEVNYGGLGKKVFAVEATSIENSEGDTSTITPDELSIYRAASICYRLYAKECLADKGQTPFKDGIGRYYEFCYFCKTDKTFKYVEGTKVLLWPVHIRQAPHFGVEFGYYPREGENEGPFDFRIWDSQYDADGLIIKAYDNLSKTSKGHIVALEEYRSPQFIKSLYPVSNEHSGKFIFNCYYLKDIDLPYLQDSYIKTEKVIPQDWVVFDATQTPDQFELKIGQAAFKAALYNTHDFFDCRWLIYGQQKSTRFNRSQTMDYQKLEKIHKMAGNLRRTGQVRMRMTGEKQEIIQARDLYRKARALARKLNLRFLLADYTFCEGTCEEILENRRMAETLFIKAKQEFANMVHLSRWTHCLNSLGILYKNDYVDLMKNKQEAKAIAAYKKARDCFQEAEQIQSRMEMQKSLVTTRGNIANLMSLRPPQAA
tara:strand:+ start:2009 stop:3721 length:1713 start_codon:yes stop_codon:yes gene_type:complete